MPWDQRGKFNRIQPGGLGTPSWRSNFTQVLPVIFLIREGGILGGTISMNTAHGMKTAWYT